MGKLGEEAPANGDGGARASGVAASSLDSAPGATLSDGQSLAPSLDDSQAFQTVDTPSARSQTIGDGPPSWPTPKPEPSSKGAGRSSPSRPAQSGSSGQLTPVSARSSGSGTYPAFPVLDWDRYEFISLLGQGGMGAVYKGRFQKILRGENQKMATRERTRNAKKSKYLAMQSRLAKALKVDPCWLAYGTGVAPDWQDKDSEASRRLLE